MHHPGLRPRHCQHLPFQSSDSFQHSIAVRSSPVARIVSSIDRLQGQRIHPHFHRGPSTIADLPNIGQVRWLHPQVYDELHEYVWVNTFS